MITHILGCIKHPTQPVQRGNCPTTFSTAVVSVQILHAYTGYIIHKKYVMVLKCLWSRGQQSWLNGVEGILHEERLRMLKLPSLEKRRRSNNVIVLCNWLLLFSSSAILSSPVNTWKLHKVAHREIQTGHEEKKITVTVVKYENRLPSKMVVASVKKHLDNALNNIFYLVDGIEIVGQLELIPVGHFQMKYSILNQK